MPVQGDSGVILIKNRKLLVFDVDGTILADDRTVLPQTLEQIRRLEKGGHAIVVATGRSYPLSIQIARQIGTNVSLVANNGALTYDFQTDNFAVHGSLNKQGIDYVLAQAQRLGRELSWSHGLNGYSVYFGKDPKSEIADPKFFIAGVARKQYDDWNKVRHTLDDAPNVYQVTIKAERTTIDSLVEQFKADLKGVCEVADTSGVYIDVNAAGINKWHAVRRIQGALGIPNELTYAFGDSSNDLLMLQNAGTGVAMGNAKDHVKQVAKRVIGNNNEPSIAEFLAQLE